MTDLDRNLVTNYTGSKLTYDQVDENFNQLRLLIDDVLAKQILLTELKSNIDYVNESVEYVLNSVNSFAPSFPRSLFFDKTILGFYYPHYFGPKQYIYNSFKTSSDQYANTLESEYSGVVCYDKSYETPIDSLTGNNHNLKLYNDHVYADSVEVTEYFIVYIKSGSSGVANILATDGLAEQSAGIKISESGGTYSITAGCGITNGVPSSTSLVSTGLIMSSGFNYITVVRKIVGEEFHVVIKVNNGQEATQVFTKSDPTKDFLIAYVNTSYNSNARYIWSTDWCKIAFYAHYNLPMTDEEAESIFNRFKKEHNL